MQRRDFLRFSTLGAAAATLAPVTGMGMTAASKKHVSQNDKVRMGFIGLGQQAMYLLSGFMSMDYVRDKTAPTDWMNGICSYSLWWIILQHHLYAWYGDKAYLEEQGDYLQALLHSVMENVDGNRVAQRARAGHRAGGTGLQDGPHRSAPRRPGMGGRYLSDAVRPDRGPASEECGRKCLV